MNKILVLFLLFLTTHVISQDCWKATYEQTLSKTSTLSSMKMDTADQLMLASLDSAGWKKVQEMLNLKIVFINTYELVNDSIYYDFKVTQQPSWLNLNASDRSGSYKIKAAHNSMEDSCGGFNFTGQTKMIAGYTAHEMKLQNQACVKIIWVSKELPSSLKPFGSNVPYAILASIEPENSYIIKEFQDCNKKANQ